MSESTRNIGQPAKIVLTETYFKPDFLKTVSQSSSSGIDPQHISFARSLYKRLKGMTSAKVAYAQKA